jgi:hypothetical protein
VHLIVAVLHVLKRGHWPDFLPYDAPGYPTPCVNCTTGGYRVGV